MHPADMQFEILMCPLPKIQKEEVVLMSVTEFVDKLTVGGIAGWAVVLLIVLLSFIQISPIKINPWDRIFAWIGRKMNEEVEEEIHGLKKQIRDLWINNHRQSILTFARECRAEISHSAEEWSHVLNLCEEYENFCEKNDVTNGVVRENTLYVRQLYQQLARDHRI